MIDRVRELESAVRDCVRSGQAIMIGGFGRGGTPFSLLEFLADNSATYRELTVVKNDANEPDLGIGMLIHQGMVKKVISTHIGLNPECVDLMNKKEIELEFVPQGIFAERIRAAGAGIPAFLTDISIGTVIGEGKPEVDFEGRRLLIERALPGDVALLCADMADTAGNCWWRGSNRNMSVVMGMACAKVIVEAKEIVQPGVIEPENVHLPGVFVDAVVQSEPRRHAGQVAGFDAWLKNRK